MTARSAKFIVVEGIEGAGKSTVIKHLENYFRDNNIKYILTREPGGTPVAEKIRDIFKADANQEKIYSETEVLLLYAARLQLVNNIIKPALSNNTWVIGDRHDLSTIAYQSGGRGLSEDFIYTIKKLVLDDFSFDYCIYLDIDPKLGLSRAASRGSLDRLEQESVAFFNKIRNKYLELAKNNNKISIIDASKSEQDVKNAVISLLEQRIMN